MPRFIIVLNDKAGAGRPGSRPEVLREAFAAAGVEAEVRSLPPEQIHRALRTAAAERPDAVIVGGGDGSVRTAASIFADTGIVLGVLPLGTLNHFAKDLGMPTGSGDAVTALAGGVLDEVDLGEVNGAVFINNCSIGSYAEAVRRRDHLRDTHGWGKGWAMARATWEVLRRLGRLRLRIAIDGGEPRTIRTPLVGIGNNRYSGHVLNQCLRQRLDAGELWLYTVHVPRRFAVVRIFLQALTRRLDEADALDARAARQIVIESLQGPVPVAADGELLDLEFPLSLRIRPRALRVLRPRGKNPAAGREPVDPRE
jgi:diacylglycerol kinase family enzyme